MVDKSLTSSNITLQNRQLPSTVLILRKIRISSLKWSRSVSGTLSRVEIHFRYLSSMTLGLKAGKILLVCSKRRIKRKVKDRTSNLSLSSSTTIRLNINRQFRGNTSVFFAKLNRWVPMSVTLSQMMKNLKVKDSTDFSYSRNLEISTKSPSLTKPRSWRICAALKGKLLIKISTHILQENDRHISD